MAAHDVEPGMARWVLKEDPDHYAWADLVREGGTEWNGVHNALALRNLKAMRPGDQAIFYHSGSERAGVGIVEITSRPRADPQDDRGSWLVEVRPLRPLRRPIPLAEVKTDPALADSDLARLGRLSVVAISDEQWTRFLAHETSARRLESLPTVGGTGLGKAGARPARRLAASRRR